MDSANTPGPASRWWTIASARIRRSLAAFSSATEANRLFPNGLVAGRVLGRERDLCGHLLPAPERCLHGPGGLLRELERQLHRHVRGHLLARGLEPVELRCPARYGHGGRRDERSGLV